MRRFIPFLLICTIQLSFSFPANDKPFYHQVKAKSGDNISKLLARYYLNGNDCNLEQFYKLNKLKKNARLIKDKKYYIPALIYTYNGKSIRTSLGLKGWEHALRIKKYNDRLTRNKRRRSSMVRSNIMWVPYHELHCVDEAPANVAPVKKKEAPKKPKKTEEERTYEKIADELVEKFNRGKGLNKYPVFGKKHSHIKVKDHKLRGKVFYIVGGHGGPDSGAVGKSGTYQLCEDEYAYDVSLRLVRNLIQHGAIAYMIIKDPDDGLRSGQYLPCDYDEYCQGNFKIPRNQKRRLFQRSDVINELYERHKKQGIKDQTVVTIHIDSNNQSHQTDVFFYYFPQSKEGKALAKKLHKTLKSKYKHRSYHGTVTARDLHMLREPKPSSVFIELGNIRNKFDQQRLIIENNRQALANWLYDGLAK